MSTIDPEQLAAGNTSLDSPVQEMHTDKELNAMNSGSSSHGSNPVNATGSYNDSVQYDLSYRVGVAENRNFKFRKTMEDVHTYVENFNNKLDWGYFAIFDGHAGNQASKWCGANLHNLIEQQIQANETNKVSEITEMSKANGTSRDSQITPNSGSVPEVDETSAKGSINDLGNQTNDTPESISTNDEAREPCKETKEADAKEHRAQDLKQGEIEILSENNNSASNEHNDNNNSNSSAEHHSHHHHHRHHHHRSSLKDISQEEEEHGGHSHEEQDVRDILNNSFVDADKYICENLPGHSGCTAAVCVIRWEVPVTDTEASGKNSNKSVHSSPHNGNAPEEEAEEEEEEEDLAHKRMLYTANVGDSRIVLMRDGKAIRLTYDHKASDQYEMKRVEKAGGLIMKSRVNGMLAVTRSIGDKFFDKLVISNPFTTSVELTSKDQFLIIACDGLWDVVEDQEACDLINDNIHDLDPSKAAKFLVDYAMQNGTTDNITVMVIFFSTYEED
ncbi:hypothetical protein ACO0QE_001437 [Hanseniaspora vineae]